MVQRAITLDRIIGGVACGLRMVLGQALCRAIPTRLHGAATRRVFDDATGWGVDGHEFEKRLFSWEEEFLSGVGRSGPVLVGGAGGGRELEGLALLGHEVIAFEPSDLVESAATVAARLGMPAVRRASYEDLPSAVHGAGPLADVPYGELSAVVLGWGSICHLTARQDRIRVLAALRQLAPEAPVLYSFNWRGADDRPYSDKARLHFDPELGFFAALQWSDVEEEAVAAGYDMKRTRSEPSPHAWLFPK